MSTVSALAWPATLLFAVAAVVLARLAFDLGRLHVALALSVGGFYVGFLWLAGTGVASLLRGGAPGADPSRASRWLLALAVPLGFLAASMDCMGLSFTGCTSACGILMHAVAPATAACTLLFAATGARGWILAADLLALAFFVPNCTCRNPVNAWWIASLGQSPACYVSGVGVYLIASTALVTRRRVLPALLCAWGVVAAAFAFWVGHHYFGVPW